MPTSSVLESVLLAKPESNDELVAMLDSRRRLGQRRGGKSALAEAASGLCILLECAECHSSMSDSVAGVGEDGGEDEAGYGELADEKGDDDLDILVLYLPR